jgi:hypothetical protein
MRQPVLRKDINTKKPIIKDQKKRLWSFSFKYFRQIDYFGIDGMQNKWFVSFLEKLHELSNYDVNLLTVNIPLKNANRYHIINWDAKNIPIKRNDIDWIEKEIIENEEDFPFFQFQLSKALGRIVGFWESDYSTFNIVLLDPKHNLQPSKKYSYKVDNTSILECEYTSLLVDIDRVKGLQCSDVNCKCKAELNKIGTNLNRGNFVYFQIDDDYYYHFVEQTKHKSVKEIMEIGITALL